MKKVMDIAQEKNVPCQISMERHIKCGIGLCGHCCIDETGLMICKDGPVFNAEKLIKTEFSRYSRDKSGSKIDL